MRADKCALLLRVGDVSTILLVILSVVWVGGEVLVDFRRCDDDDEEKGIRWGEERSSYNESPRIDGRILTAEAGLF